jgi:flagellar basal-body rod protein FlgB
LKLFSNTISSLDHALNYSSLKQKIISQNIANVDTPNYKAKDVRFKTVFQNELNQEVKMNRTDARHLDFSGESNSRSGITSRQNVMYNNNGNSVDLDQEMSDLATNQIYYNALVDQLNSKFSTLQNVIRGGK